MELSKKLLLLRKEKGISQEALADMMGVSRQAISKWESGQSFPDINNLITLSEIYCQSIDDMIKDNNSLASKASEQENSEQTDVQIKQEYFYHPPRYEYKSKRTLWGIPLVHINIGYGLPRVAKGIFAIGDVAIGAVALGGLSVGGLSIGGVSLGLLCSIGGLSLGSIAFGGVAIGILAFGGLAIGVGAFGGCAIAAELAVGGGAVSANVAVGGSANGAIAVMGGEDGLYRLIENGTTSMLNGKQIALIMKQNLSAFWNLAINILSNIMN